MSDLAIRLGYLVLGGLFVWAGIDHFRRFAVVSGLLAARHWPRPKAVLVAVSVFQIVAGLGLALGVGRPAAALALAGFTIAASLLLVNFWRFDGPEREGMRSTFVVNMGLAGGLVLAFGESL
ncbi:MAG: DoxX family protein [Rhodovulum sulfidophilum]|uniref:DoxX family protein n=1 Tax=Rhodovulum sulfidophilum TaxID=35806 RepID=A0A2W5QC59_RHOSU|nr:MAG: DoxX family protein [Rhodovulum sulfidophilum]